MEGSCDVDDKTIAVNELKALIDSKVEEDENNSQWTPEEEQAILSICKQYPDIESGRIGTKYFGKYPIHYLVEFGASLKCVQSYCEIFPDAIQRKAFLAGDSIQVACESCHTRPGVVAYLVEKGMIYQQKLRSYTLIKFLLKRPNVSVEDVQSLFKGCLHWTVATENELLRYAVESPNSLAVVEYVLGQCPSADTLVLESLQEGNLGILPKVLARIKTLDIRLKDFDINAWSSFMRVLETCSTLQKVSINLHAGLASSGNELLESLSDALAAIPKIHSLAIRGSSWMQSHGPLLTRGLTNLLKNNALQSLYLDECYVLRGSMLEALTQNTSLTHMEVLDLVDSDNKRKDLLDILKRSNASLQTVVIRSSGGNAKTYDNIRYWTTLNGLGRATARSPDTSLNQLVGLLHNANVQYSTSSRDTEGEVKQAQFLYGLLRENPSIWQTRRKINGSPARPHYAIPPLRHSYNLQGQIYP